MMGLMFLGFFAVYLALSVWAVKAASGWAKTNNKKPWLWGGLAAFVMYNLVFWDWIPTVVAHKYYCSTEAGFWVYKTVDQWKKENPGVMEVLVENVSATRQQGDDAEFTDKYSINQRISKIVKQYRVITLLPVYRLQQSIIDANNNEELARYVYFFSGRGTELFKFWERIEGCKVSKVGMHNDDQFYEFENKLTGSVK